jgi:hypothetical protein
MSAAAPTIQIGSQEHRQILARFFLDSHVDFVPESIVWPQLADSSRARLTRLPFWQEAVATENITSNTVAAAAQLEPDPEVRKAIELQGFEENRHARLLVALTSHYRIKVDMPPRFEPRSFENDFLFAGFGECFDSFFAFGLFALAQKSGYFGPELIAIFEPVVQEEARHILFFVNWAHQDVGECVTLHSLLELCLRENDRRIGQYDARLLRPRLVPALARFVYQVLPARI